MITNHSSGLCATEEEVEEDEVVNGSQIVKKYILKRISISSHKVLGRLFNPWPSFSTRSQP
eukprot:2519807-Amphidinium_carterae.1